MNYKIISILNLLSVLRYDKKFYKNFFFLPLKSSHKITDIMKMGNKKKNYALIACLLLISLYQNCAPNSYTASTKSSQSLATNGGNNTGADNSNVNTNTDSTGSQACDPNTVGLPSLTYTSSQISSAYSGLGAIGGRAPSGKATLIFSGISVGTNCSKAVSVQCNVTGLKDTNNQPTVSFFDVSGQVTDFMNNQNTLQCQSSPNTLDNSGSFTVNLNVNDNDSQQRCFSGNPRLEVTLRSAADPTKMSQKITIPINIINNCWSETKETPATDRFDFLGTASAMSADWFAALAPGDDGLNNDTSNLGAVYMYKKDPATLTWKLNQIVRTKDESINVGEAGDNPSSIALFGNYMAIGSYASKNNLGAVYIFKNISQKWTFQLKISGTSPSGLFGYSVALNNQFLFVGAPQDNTLSGGLSVYSLSDFTLQQKLRLNSSLDNYFGTSISVQGNILAVGGTGYPLNLGAHTGFVNIYNFDATSSQWVERANNPLSFNSSKDKVSGKDSAGKSITINIPSASQLGFSVSVGSNFIAAGAPGLNRDGSNTTGSIFVLSLLNNEVRQLTDPANEMNVSYGSSLQFSGNNLFVGSKTTKSLKGAVDSWSLSSTASTFNRRILSLTGAPSDAFGFSLAVSNTDLIVGARLNDEPVSDNGSLHFFKIGQP